MKQLANAINQCKSYKDRQQLLSDSLDILSFDHAELYIMLFKDMKRREQEVNAPNNITKWLDSSKTNSYVKLHEALMLIKSHNVMVKEEYMNNLKQMLCQTLENGTNIDIVFKICCLIENSPHLTTIYRLVKLFCI